MTIVLAALLSAQHGLASDKLTLILRPARPLSHSIVRIADVADIHGGNAEQRQLVGSLDLDDAPPSGRAIEITPQQVAFRVQLEGISLSQFAVRGTPIRVEVRPSPTGSTRSTSGATTSNRRLDSKAASVLAVSRAKEDSVRSAAEDILAAAEQSVLDRLPWPSTDVQFQVIQPSSRELQELQTLRAATVFAEMRSPGPPIGRASLRVEMTTPEGSRIEVPVVLDVKHFDNVILATKGLQRGQTLTVADLFVDRRDVTNLTNYCDSIEQLVGRRVKRAVGSLQPMRTSDVETETSDATASPVVVKRRDRLKVTAKVGVLAVTVTGEALQDGRVGDVISVKNVDSNSILRGRVISSTEVEVQE